MASKSFLSSSALLAICAAVAAAALVWTGWDMFGPTHRPMLQGADDSFYYYWLPSVIIDHDLDFSNQLADSGTVDAALRDRLLSQPHTATGHLAVKYPPGWAIGSLPFFLLVQAFMPPGSTGFEPPYLVAVWLGQLLYAAAGLWLATRILRRYFEANTAAIAVLVGWLASPLVYYQTARLSMSHSQVFALAAATFWLALRIADGDTRKRTWFLLGFSAALLVVTRNVAIVYLAMPVLVVATSPRRNCGSELARDCSPVKSTVALAAGAVGPVAVQLIAWKIIFGSWFVYSYGGERFDFVHLHLGAVLFSPRHGWFYWHPLMLVGMVAFIAWALRRLEGRAWLVSLAAITLLNAAWPTWWLGSSFGHRGFEAATLFAMIGLAALLEIVRARPRWRRALAIVVALAICWNVALLALFLTRRIPREEPVTYRDDAAALIRFCSGGL